MIGLSLFYLGVAIVAIAERKYAVALYWFGAVLLNTGVLLMDKG